MYGHWAANVWVVLATILTVGACVLVHYEGLDLLSRWLARRHESQRRRKVLYGIFGVLALQIIEIWLFGVALWGLMLSPANGGLAGVPAVGFFDAVYLSAMTYTTVGAADMTPVGAVRFLAGTEALVGFLLITWSASFTFLEMERFWRR